MENTIEYDLLQHIKFCLECKNESQAIRLIEQYGFVKQEERYTEQELKLWLIHRDVYLYNHYTTYVKSGLPLQSVNKSIWESIWISIWESIWISVSDSGKDSVINNIEDEYR